MAVPEGLLGRLDESRRAFVAALEAVDADLATVPGVMDDWSVRDIVVHVAAWCEHAVGALDLAIAGRGAEFAYSTRETDAMNLRILEEARRTAPSAALEREAAAFTAFRERLAALDPSLLGLRLGNGDTVEEVIRYDGPDHYAEHTAHLRAWFGEDEGVDEDEGEDEDDDPP
jgi:hypothetical protein